MYLNDLENYLLVNGSPNLAIRSADLDVYLKHVLPYADDTVIFASSEKTLIQTLDFFANFFEN